MVLFLNYLPVILTLSILIFTWLYVRKDWQNSKRNQKAIGIAIVAIIVTNFGLRALGNTYIGKADNVSQKIETPSIEQLEEEAATAVIRDVQRKPDLTSTEEYNALTDWRANKAKREESKKVDTEK